MRDIFRGPGDGPPPGGPWPGPLPPPGGPNARPVVWNRAATSADRDLLRRVRPQLAARADRRDWYSIRNVGERSAEIFIYDEIGYWGVSADDFCRDLAALNVDTIDLRLNSPGGDAFDGIAIYNSLRMHRATVHGYVDALAASAASVIAMACDSLTMRRSSRLMIHDASGLAVGRAADMRAFADLLDALSDDIAATYAAKAGGTVAEWRERMLAETWYSAVDAVEIKLADQRDPDPGEGEEEEEEPDGPMPMEPDGPMDSVDPWSALLAEMDRQCNDMVFGAEPDDGITPELIDQLRADLKGAVTR